MDFPYHGSNRSQNNSTLESIAVPVNSRKADGTARLWVAQNMSVFLSIYKPGSIIIGFARWNLPNT